MLRLWILLLTIRPALETKLRRAERGSVTTEYVLWAVAVIAIVVAAVKAYVTSQAGHIK